ncbi:chromosome partitioning protein ParA [Chrysanthemum yellows phytoplasma]|uniref:chromosome partitioning protein ParA n=1 Tax=Chrysanthemum yellows phytoplasma TaxID=238674 RepID=UPI000A058CD5|nr:chromosome partitioning protein ParA [Chrysanthemum yellows phytoplasma]
MQQGLHIEALEGTIKALENVSGKYLEENAELRHEINKLKEQIKDEQKAHEETKVQLQTRSDNLTQKQEELTKIDLMIKAQENTYSGAIKPLTTKITNDAVKITKRTTEKVTSWFKSWF